LFDADCLRIRQPHVTIESGGAQQVPLSAIRNAGCDATVVATG
jgi:hypothetical protein